MLCFGNIFTVIFHPCNESLVSHRCEFRPHLFAAIFQVTERLRYNQRQEEATQLGMSLLLEESQQQCQQLIDKNDPSQFNKTITIHGCADFFGLPSLVKDLLQKSRGMFPYALLV